MCIYYTHYNMCIIYTHTIFNIYTRNLFSDVVPFSPYAKFWYHPEKKILYAKICFHKPLLQV